MKFGVHFQIACSPNQAPFVRYQESLTQAVLAESLGFDSIWPVEQHFNQQVSVLPAPMLFLAAVAAKTQSIRLGTAITILPFHHPVRIAEELAMLDVMSGGRVEFGFGRGSVPAHFEKFGVAIEEGRERMLESLQVIESLLSQGGCSFTGKHFKVEGTGMAPMPIQSPFPTPRAAANSLETFELMGRLGYPIFAASHVNPFFRLTEMFAAYHAAFAQAGHGPEKSPSADLLCPVFVGQSEAEVATIVAESLENFKQIALAQIVPTLNDLSISSLDQRVDYLKNMSFEQVNRDVAIFGDVDTCIERIRNLHKTFGFNRLICWFDPGGLVPHDSIQQSMQLFSSSVMPAFAD